MRNPFEDNKDTVELSRFDPEIKQKTRYLQKAGWYFDRSNGDICVFLKEKNPVLEINSNLKYQIVALMFVTIFVVWMVLASVT